MWVWEYPAANSDSILGHDHGEGYPSELCFDDLIITATVYINPRMTSIEAKYLRINFWKTQTIII